MPKREGALQERKQLVYLHRRPSDGSLMYVGIGKDRRPWQFSQRARNADWHAEVALYGDPMVEIVAEGLTAQEAGEMEQRLIAEAWALGESIVNIAIGGAVGNIGVSPKKTTRLLLSHVHRLRAEKPEVRASLSAHQVSKNVQRWLEDDDMTCAILGVPDAAVSEQKIDQIHAFVANKDKFWQATYNAKIEAIASEAFTLGLQRSADGSFGWRRYLLGKGIIMAFGPPGLVPEDQALAWAQQLNSAFPDLEAVEVVRSRIQEELRTVFGLNSRPLDPSENGLRKLKDGRIYWTRSVAKQTFKANLGSCSHISDEQISKWVRTLNGLVSDATELQSAIAAIELEVDKLMGLLSPEDPDYGFSRQSSDGSMFWRKSVGGEHMVVYLGRATFVNEQQAKDWVRELNGATDLASVTAIARAIKDQVLKFGGKRSNGDPECGFAIIVHDNKMRWKRIVDGKRMAIDLGRRAYVSEAQGRAWARELNAAMDDAEALVSTMNKVARERERLKHDAELTAA